MSATGKIWAVIIVLAVLCSVVRDGFGPLFDVIWMAITTCFLPVVIILIVVAVGHSRKK